GRLGGGPATLKQGWRQPRPILQAAGGLHFLPPGIGRSLISVPASCAFGLLFYLEYSTPQPGKKAQAIEQAFNGLRTSRVSYGHGTRKRHSSKASLMAPAAA